MNTLLLAFTLLPQSQPLPKPTGPATVGTRTFELVDHTRPDPVTSLRPRATERDPEPRTLGVRAFFPTQAKSTEGNRAKYASKQLVDALVGEKFYGQSEERLRAFGQVKSHARTNVSPATGHRAVVLISHGLGTGGFLHQALAAELASRKYLVLVIDHPYGGVTQLTDGRILLSSEDPKLAEGAFGLRQAEWAKDLLFVIGHLEKRPLSNLGADSGRVAVLGHSLGGAAAVQAGNQEPRLLAVVNMDGAPFDLGALRCSTLVLRSQPVYSEADLKRRGRTKAKWKAMGAGIVRKWLDRQTAGTTLDLVSVRGTGHMSFTDAPFLMPDTITRFGGEVLDFGRAHTVIAEIIDAYLEERIGEKKRFLKRVAKLPEARARRY